MFQLLNANVAPYLLTVSHPDSSPKTSIGSGQQAIAILRSQAVRSEEQRLVRRPAVHVRQLLPSPWHDIGQQPRQATGQVVVTRGRQTYFGRFFSVHFTSSFCIAHSSLCKHIWISHWPTVTVFINKWCRRIGHLQNEPRHFDVNLHRNVKAPASVPPNSSYLCLMSSPCVFLTCSQTCDSFFIYLFFSDSFRMRRSVTWLWAAMLDSTASLTNLSVNRSLRDFVLTFSV